MRQGCGILVFLLLVGCVGIVFGPGYSCDDLRYFAERPVVVEKGDQFVLRWRFGEMGFWFLPEYAVRDGALRFSLQGTASTGSVSGHEGEIPIKGRRNLEALRAGGAFWWEPDGGLVPLEIISEPADWPLPLHSEPQASS